MSNPKPGDTVDPRTLPVGAVFRDGPCGDVYVVAFLGYCVRRGESKAHPIISNRAILISIPQPVADEVVELGTLAQGTRCVFDEAERGSVDPEFFESTCEVLPYTELTPVTQTKLVALLNGRTAHFWNTRKVRRVPAPTPAKRPPCDACGEESLASADGLPHTHVDRQPAFLCRNCFCHRRSEDVDRDVRARRAQQPTPTVASLPTYDQIAGWLGAEWVMMHHTWSGPMQEGQRAVLPFPWWLDISGDVQVARCYIKHTPTGQRVEVTAPREAIDPLVWTVWFSWIKRAAGKAPGIRRTGSSDRFRDHVRWLDPDTKTSTGLETHQRAQPEDVGKSVAPSEPVVSSQSRWQTRDPARIAALEAKLAEQVASGGQDCKSARWLLERADDLRREEEARSRYPLAASDAVGRREAWGVDPFVQPGRRMSRFELPPDQRLDRKRTGR